MYARERIRGHAPHESMNQARPKQEGPTQQVEPARASIAAQRLLKMTPWLGSKPGGPVDSLRPDALIS